jgi:hypothetical protein
MSDEEDLPTDGAAPVAEQLAAEKADSLPPPELPPHPTVWQLHAYLEQLMAVFPETANLVVCSEGDSAWNETTEEYQSDPAHIEQAAFVYAEFENDSVTYAAARKHKSPRVRPNILLLSRHSD